MAWRSFSQWAPVQALPDTAALPSRLFGPVDLLHGFRRLIASLCRLRRSGVHPVAAQRQPLFFAVGVDFPKPAPRSCRVYFQIQATSISKPRPFLVRGTSGVTALDIGQHAGSPMKPGNNHLKNLFPAVSFPAFGLAVNVWPCTSLQRNSLIYQ